MRKQLFFLAVLIVLSPAIAHAQKDADAGESYGIFDTQEQYSDFMGQVKSDPEMRKLVPMINDIVLEREIGWTADKYGMGSNALGLLGNEKVRNDLEMMDYQYEEMMERNAELQKQAAQQIRNLDLSDMAKVAEEVQKIREQTLKQMREGLLPHQVERLEQIQAQSRLRNRSLIDIITSEPVKTRLVISDEQAEQLRAAEQQVEDDLQRQIAELREQAKERLLEALDPEQREKVDTIFGQTFNFESAKGDRFGKDAEKEERRK